MRQPLLGRARDAIEVRPPEPDGHQRGQRHGADQLGVERVILRADADRDDRFAQADDDEQAVALGEVRDGDALEPRSLSRVSHAGPA